MKISTNTLFQTAATVLQAQSNNDASKINRSSNTTLTFFPIEVFISPGRLRIITVLSKPELF